MWELVTPADACDLRTRFVTKAFNHRTSPGRVHIMLFCTKIRELLYDIIISIQHNGASIIIMSIETVSAIYYLYTISVGQENYISFDLIFVYNLDGILRSLRGSHKGSL